MKCKLPTSLLFVFLTITTSLVQAQTATLPVTAWARNSVNAVIFRKNSVASHAGLQYTSYYDANGFVVIAKRVLGTTVWETKTTTLKGNIADAHNAISIMVDGAGFLHLSWDHHNNALNYCKSTAAGSLSLTAKMVMIGAQETSVSYPEFHKLLNGDLIFMYRDGASGNGNLVINKYNSLTKRWTRLHNSLINGEGLRNAYWQAAVDETGVLHLSWVWRESADVASNHDLCYAKSTDGGITWAKSDGAAYRIPIVAATAEYALRIPQNSELINQTSICGDNKGNPYICSYWKGSGTSIPQLHIVYRSGAQWRTSQVTMRRTPFTLSGVGTKKIPISRPQIVVQANGTSAAAYVIYRDVEQGDKVTLVYNKNVLQNQWTLLNLTNSTTGSWEPSFDTELWKSKKLLNIYVQRVGQGDGETLENLPPQVVTILEWNPCSLSQPASSCAPTATEKTIDKTSDFIKVFPNPFNSGFKIGDAKDCTIQIYDQHGVLIEQNIVNDGNEYGNGLPAGIFHLKIINNYMVTWRKVIKY